MSTRYAIPLALSSVLLTASAPAQTDPADSPLGVWELSIGFQGQAVPAKLLLERGAAGGLRGSFECRSAKHELLRARLDGALLSFELTGRALRFQGSSSRPG